MVLGLRKKPFGAGSGVQPRGHTGKGNPNFPTQTAASIGEATALGEEFGLTKRNICPPFRGGTAGKECECFTQTISMRHFSGISHIASIPN